MSFWRYVRFLGNRDAHGLLFREGRMPCDGCPFPVSVEGLEPFTLVKCRVCKHPNFVPLKVNGFMLYEPLGAGGMASAFKAFHRDQPGSTFVVKVLHRDKRSDPVMIQALSREGEIHSRIPNHPNLPRYVAHGMEDDEWFYATELIEGERLKDHLAKEGRLGHVEALQLCLDLLKALDHIHSAGYLYRDLSAGNVIIRPSGQAVLLDFGLTESLEEAAGPKESRRIQGSMEYVPPERFERSGEDEASVIYSLGMLMFLVLTGSPFVVSDTKFGQYRQQVGARLACAADRMPGCPAELVAMVERMIRQDPEGRFQSFPEAAEHVRDLLSRLAPERSGRGAGGTRGIGRLFGRK